MPERIVKSWLKGNPELLWAAVEDYKDAVQSGLIRRFPHTGEVHVSIDPRRIPDVIRLIGDEEE